MSDNNKRSYILDLLDLLLDRKRLIEKYIKFCVKEKNIYFFFCHVLDS